jgi:hypothetical protein
MIYCAAVFGTLADTRAIWDVFIIGLGWQGILMSYTNSKSPKDDNLKTHNESLLEENRQLKIELGEYKNNKYKLADLV